MCGVVDTDPALKSAQQYENKSLWSNRFLLLVNTWLNFTTISMIAAIASIRVHVILDSYGILVNISEGWHVFSIWSRLINIELLITK